VEGFLGAVNNFIEASKKAHNKLPKNFETISADKKY
jgi:hypothetical protein